MIFPDETDTEFDDARPACEPGRSGWLRPCPGGLRGRDSGSRWSSAALECYRVATTSGQGHPPGPHTTSAPPQGGSPTWPVPELSMPARAICVGVTPRRPRRFVEKRRPADLSRTRRPRSLRASARYFLGSGGRCPWLLLNILWCAALRQGVVVGQASLSRLRMARGCSSVEPDSEIHGPGPVGKRRPGSLP